MAAELRDLELLVAIVDTGSITAGAARCATSLSAASVRIAALESRFGVRLLERNRRGVSATSAGAAVAEQARTVLAAAADLESTVAARARGVEHVVRLVVGSAAVDSLPEFLAAALNRMPDVRVDLVEMSSTEGVEAVVAGRADLAVVSSAAEVRPGSARPLWDDDLVVVGPRSPGPPPPMTLAQAYADPAVALSASVPLQQLVERHARAAGIEPTYRVRLPSLAAVCTVASTGVGRAVVPRRSARLHGVPAAMLHPLDEPFAARTAMLVVRDPEDLEPVTARFVDLLREHGRELAAEDRRRA